MPLKGRCYQAVPGFESHLVKELADHGLSTEAAGGLVFASLPEPFAAPSVFWQQNCWETPFRAEFDSISQAAGILRDIQRNWVPALSAHFRRGALISEKLPPVSVKRRPFPWTLPSAPMGAWTLLDPHTLLASAVCSSPFPNGVIEFEEDKINPPSRAYLKLWEALTLSRALPKQGSLCLDAGASPGGWTWALSQLGARVIAVDRALLDERVASLPNVSFIKHDAFTLKPSDIGRVDWLVCDVVCYPPRLFDWIEQWLASRLCENFICTIKMQGEPDFETTRRFAAIPHSTVVHLHHNKHELSFLKIADKGSALL